jgi:hypothetical protein
MLRRNIVALQYFSAIFTSLELQAEDGSSCGDGRTLINRVKPTLRSAERRVGVGNEN